MKKDSNRSGKGLVIAIIAIIIIAIAAGAAYFFLLKPSTPKDVFVSQLNAIMNESNAANNANSEKVNATIGLSGNIETTNQEIAAIAQIINQGKLKFNVQADTNAKKVLVGANVNYQNEDLLDAKVFYQDGDNNMYLFVRGLLDKYIKLDTKSAGRSSEDMAALFEIKDVKTANQIIQDTVVQNLKDEYFSKEEVDGMTKNTMKISANELKNYVETVTTSLKNNEKFLNCFSSADKIKANLEETIEELKENVEEEYASANIEIALFTKGNGKDVQTAEFKLDVSATQGGTFVIRKESENSKVFYAEVKTESEGMPVTARPLSGTIKTEKAGNTIKYVITADNIPSVGKVTLNMDVTKEDNVDLNVDTANAVDPNTMTQLDQMQLLTNLQKMKIYQYIAPLMGGMQ